MILNFRFTPRVGNITASFRSLLGGNSDTGDEGRIPVDKGKDGEILFKEDIIQFVNEQLEKRRSERTGLEQQWVLNSNFLIGNQYCDINTHLGTVKQLQPVYDWLEREAYNQISPLIETRIANLKKITYRMQCKPRTNEYDDWAKAEVSSSLLRHIQSVSDFESKKNTMIAWNELCGNCFWLSWWDSQKGEEFYDIQSETTEDGQTIVKKEVIREGDLDYGLVTPYEVFPESIYKQTVAAQRSIIIEQVKSVEEIYDLYGIEVEGKEVKTFALTPIPSGYGLGKESSVMALGHRTVEDSQTVITYLERPSRRYVNGRMIICCGDELVYYGDLPYGRIPLIQVICREIPGQFFGKSVIEDLIPRQRAYNGCINRIHEYIKRVAIGSYITEEGSVDIDEYEENGQAPGAMIVYRKGSEPPVPIPNGTLPSEIMTERYNLVRDMEYVAGVSQLTTSGAAPSGITSGVALEAIRATDDTRLSLTGDHIRNSVRALASLWLEIYKQFAKTKRVMACHGNNGIGSVMVWTGEDITSYDVEFVAENELLYSEDAQKQRFIEAYQLGLFTDENGRIPERAKFRALESFKVANFSEIMNINLLQLQAAQRENSFFEDGIIPEMGQFDDHKIHIEEHMRFILQMDFQFLKKKKPEFASAMEEHIKAHQKKMAESAIKNMMASGNIGAKVQ